MTIAVDFGLKQEKKKKKKKPKSFIVRKDIALNFAPEKYKAGCFLF